MATPSRSPLQRSPRPSLPIRARLAMRASLDVPRAARHSFRWDIWAGAFSGAYMGMLFPFVVRIARGDLHAPETAIAVMTAAPFVGNLISPLWARQMEGRAKMPFVIVSWIPARSLLLLMAFAVQPWFFVALVGGLQFIGTISSPAYTSIMRDIYPDRSRGRLMGYVRMVMQVMMFFATLITGRLLDHTLSYRVLFPIAALVGFAAAFCFSRVQPLAPEPAVPEGTSPLTARAFVLDTLSILRENIGYRWFALSVFTYGFGNLMVQPLFALYQVDELHITNTQIANLVNFSSIISILGFFWWGRYMDRRGAPRTVLFGILLVSMIPAIYLITRNVNGLFLAYALHGFGFACIELSYMQSILLYAAPGRAAQYQSLHSLLLGIRGIIAPLVGIPLMKHFGYHPIFALALVLMVIGGFMQWAATRRED